MLGIASLQAVEKLKAMCKVPEQILCPHERRTRVIPSDSALVEDPVAELQRESLVHPWTPEEKRIFQEKFTQFPK
eukprot:scaffold67738_cov34-Prasinocladus_malaysianus.AAC.1